MGLRRFSYKPIGQILELLKVFKEAANGAIRIGLEKKVKSRFALITEVYSYFKERCGLHKPYILSASEVAFSIIRKHRKWVGDPTLNA